MTLDDAHGRTPRVAVASSRESAAAAFGVGEDDLFVTTYADLEAEVDLGTVAALDLVLDADFAPALERACVLVGDGGPAVRVAVSPRTSGEAPDVLDRAGVTVVEPVTGGANLVLRLVPGTTPGSAPLGVVLDALRAAAMLNTSAPARRRGPGAAAVADRPTPRLVQLLDSADRWLRSPRRRGALLAGLLVLLAVLVLLGLVPGTTRVLTGIVLPVLLVVVLVGAAAGLYATLLLARQVHRQTGRLERMVLRNRAVLDRRTSGLGRRLSTIEQGQARMPFLEQYVEAVAEHGAATSARLRDVLEMLEVDQRAD